MRGMSHLRLAGNATSKAKMTRRKRKNVAFTYIEVMLSGASHGMKVMLLGPTQRRAVPSKVHPRDDRAPGVQSVDHHGMLRHL